MKKILPAFIGCLLAATPVVVKAQSFTGQSANDTVYANVSGLGVVHNDITNNTSSPLILRWKVTATSFPTDWLSNAAFGICDNNLCRNNTGDTLLWRVATNTSGNTFQSNAYAPGVAGAFNLSMDLSASSVGTHWVTVTITDPALFSRNVTFILTKSPVGVSNVNAESNVVLYPNPATDEVNLLFNGTSDIKTVAVYNVIGKMMSVYKVNGSSANLNISNMPSGIYFVRMANSHGDVVVTRKFTKQ